VLHAPVLMHCGLSPYHGLMRWVFQLYGLDEMGSCCRRLNL
jgi:hypothetical protein